MKTMLVSAAVLSCTLFVVWAAPQKGSNPREADYGEYHRFVFYAVLEGCYEDGLTSADIDHIIPKAENGKREMSASFVYTCPLCHPAFEAFRLYGSRQPFHGQKVTTYDTFGQGLDEKTRQLLGGAPNERRNAIQSLISRWIGKRAKLLRLDQDERTELMKTLKEMKGEGDAALKRFQNGEHGDYFRDEYQDWKKCPVCEGSVEAKM